MEEREINPAESLEIMQSMILKAQRNYSIDSFYYIMWGWLTFSAAMLSYFLGPILHEKTGLVWLLMPLGGLVSFIYGTKQSKKQKVKTHAETHVNQVWLTLGLAFIFLVIAIFLGQNFQVLPTFILLYGIGIFCTGRIIKFMPMIIGGAMCFPLFVFCSYYTFHDFLNQYLILAFALMVSYIIPGHLLKAKFKS
ncbi:MAG: hypothetical protein V4565_09120 [Bacteroidota bacterium]